MRKRNRLPLWRTHYYQQQQQEAFFYQKIALYFTFEVITDIPQEGETWTDCFFRLCDTDQCRMPPEQLNSIRELQTVILQQQEDILQSNTYQEENPREQASLNFAHNINRITNDQKTIYDWFVNCSTSTGVAVVYGSAGTGKSFLLRLLADTCILENITPVILAPTGVAAHSVKGRTIHSYFGIDADTNAINLVRLQDTIKVHQHLVYFIDECSMINYELVNALSTAFQNVLGNTLPFGGASVFFFGDHAQLPPVDTRTGYFFQHPAILSSTTFLLQTPLRQSEEEVQFLKFLNQIRLNQFDQNNC